MGGGEALEALDTILLIHTRRGYLKREQTPGCVEVVGYSVYPVWHAGWGSGCAELGMVLLGNDRDSATVHKITCSITDQSPQAHGSIWWAHSLIYRGHIRVKPRVRVGPSFAETQDPDLSMVLPPL